MLAVAAFPAALPGQEASATAASPFALAAFAPEPDDPSYELYREGYGAVLAEEWDRARRHFAELQRRYPASPYADDAAYWTAYSWKETDPGRAAVLYRKLLREFPQSPYMDDAVADLRLLEVRAELARIPSVAAPPAPPHEIRIALTEELNRLRETQYRLQAMQKQMQIQHLQVFGEGDTLVIRTLPPRRIGEDPAIDPALRMRLQAMQEMTRNRDDADAYRALRSVVLDPRQPAPLRLSAVYSLGTIRRPETGPFLLEVARSANDIAVRRSAIEVYARTVPERGKAVNELITLFRSFTAQEPKDDPRLGTTLYAIASIGDARAVDFLAEVARTHPSDGLRSSAVLYLGTMGTERSRAALVRLLQGE